MEEKESQFTRVAEHLFIRPQTGRYYAIVKKHGRRIRQSLKTKLRDVAASRLHDLLVDLGAAPVQVARGRDIPTFKQASKLFTAQMKRRVLARRMAQKTFDCIDQCLGKAAEKLGHLRIDKITAPHVKRYLDGRGLVNSGRTCQIDATQLRKLFAFGRSQGWCWADVMKEAPKFSGTPKRVHVPTPGEVRVVLDWLRGPTCPNKADGRKAADFVEFLCLSGCRIQGAQTVRWEDVHFDRGFLTVTEKGSKPRDVDLFPGLRAFLEARRQPRGLLFPNTHESKKGKRFCPKKSLITACEKIGARRFTFHACRHFFATQCLEAGISASTVAGWLGHVDNGVLVMRLYGNHITRRHFAEQALRVPVRFDTLPSFPASAAPCNGHSQTVGS